MECFTVATFFFESSGARHSRPLLDVTPASFLVRRVSQTGILLVLLNTVAHGQFARGRQDPRVKEAAGLVAKGGAENLSRAFRLYEEAAKDGDADAMNETAKCYFDGIGVAKDLGKGLDWFWRGSGSSKKASNNLKKAAEWLGKEANAGDAKAMYNLGRLYGWDTGVTEYNWRKAAEWFEKAANAGEVAAMVQLGSLYNSGAVVGQYRASNGVQRDERKAALWFEKAASAGDVPSMNKIGNFYERGMGVTKDQRKAVEWYAKGASAGNAEAMYNLAICYAAGQGVAPDKTLAMQWLKKSAKEGNTEASDAIFDIENPGVRAAAADAASYRRYKEREADAAAQRQRDFERRALARPQ